MSRSLRRRLEPALVKQIAREYEAGSTTPSLCETYSLSKTGMLRLLRDEGVALRRRPLTDDQVKVAQRLYERGHPIAAIATRLDTSYVEHRSGGTIPRQPRSRQRRNRMELARPAPPHRLRCRGGA